MTFHIFIFSKINKWAPFSLWVLGLVALTPTSRTYATTTTPTSPTHSNDTAMPQPELPSGGSTKTRFADKKKALRVLKEEYTKYHKNSPCRQSVDSDATMEKRKIAQKEVSTYDWKNTLNNESISPHDVMETLLLINNTNLVDNCILPLSTLELSTEAWVDELCSQPKVKYVESIQRDANWRLTVRRLAVVRNLRENFMPGDANSLHLLECMETWHGLGKADKQIFMLAAQNYSENIFTDYLEARLFLGDSKVPALYEELEKDPALVSKLPR